MIEGSISSPTHVIRVSVIHRGNTHTMSKKEKKIQIYHYVHNKKMIFRLRIL